MKDVEWGYWNEQIRQYADLMDLRDWEIVLHRDPPSDPNSIASSHSIYGRRVLKIRISEKFMGDPPQEQRETIIHELLHAHTQPLQCLVDQTFEDGENTLFTRLHAMYLEVVVDSIAVVLARHLDSDDQEVDEDG